MKRSQNKFFVAKAVLLGSKILLSSLRQLRVLQKSETVAQKWDCRRKRPDNGEIRRLSHFSATVWTAFKSVFDNHPSS